MTATEPTACPVEECDETVDYAALYDHLYGDHDASELCATVANLVADTERLTAELANRVAAIAQVRETCARLYTDPDEETNPYRVGQDKMADLILEQLDEHSRALIEQQRAER